MCCVDPLKPPDNPDLDIWLRI